METRQTTETPETPETKPSRNPRRLFMQALPGCEYYLYTMLRKQLMLTTLRDVFVVGMRLMYACGHDPQLQSILFNTCAEVRASNLDLLSMQDKAQQPRYEAFPF